ncbi:MAG: site-2 protease family protein [Phycisphaerales bacterium]
MPDTIINLLQLLLIVFGFGLVVFVHELGHFLAARWAGVRVLAFAVGFGPAMLSYRKGMGFRRGSSDAAYQQLVYAAQGEQGEAREAARAALAGRVSPTEYRLNWLPLGGYVKMLGQDDADPGHRSAEPDSFNVKPVWKRMVIISAGVVANLVSAALIFVAVFALGLEKPAPVIGTVAEGQPAAAAGLRAGDRILSVNGDPVRSFDDAQMAVLTAHGGRPLRIEVERPGLAAPITLEVLPDKSDDGVLTIGITAAGTTTLGDPGSAEGRAMLRSLLDSAGLDSIGPGWRLVAINGEPVGRIAQADAIADASGGAPLTLSFAGPEGESVVREIRPEPLLQVRRQPAGDDVLRIEHLAGLAPVMSVGSIEPSSPGYAAGLREGDVFARLGGTEYPDEASGILEVRSRAGSRIDAVVLRNDRRETLVLPVSRQGRIGFGVGGTDGLQGGPAAALVTNVPGLPTVVTRPGSRLVSIDGQPVGQYADLAAAVQRAGETGASTLTVVVAAPLQDAGGEPVLERIALPVQEAAEELSWSLPAALGFVEPDTVVVRSESPVQAITMGLAETHRIMLTTYLTFARLAQGSIAPQMLNGPVGIVHAGTSIADRGLAWLLFFFALVSVNLAVINFLPIPITDGGHMVFLLWEQLTGRPVSVAVQNLATLAGLVLIVGLFLFVTYNDVLRLIGS